MDALGAILGLALVFGAAQFLAAPKTAKLADPGPAPRTLGWVMTS